MDLVSRSTKSIEHIKRCSENTDSVELGELPTNNGLFPFFFRSQLPSASDQRVSGDGRFLAKRPRAAPPRALEQAPPRALGQATPGAAWASAGPTATSRYWRAPLRSAPASTAPAAPLGRLHRSGLYEPLPERPGLAAPGSATP